MYPEHSNPASAGPMWLVIYKSRELNNKKGFGDRHLLEPVRFLSFGGSPEKLGLCDRHIAAKLGSLKSSKIKANVLCCSPYHLVV